MLVGVVTKASKNSSRKAVSQRILGRPSSNDLPLSKMFATSIQPKNLDQIRKLRWPEEIGELLVDHFEAREPASSGKLLLVAR